MKRYLIPVAYMILIFISSSIPIDKEIKWLEFVMKIDPTLQNFLHIPVYALLSYLWFGVFWGVGYSVMLSLLLSFLTAFGYGVFNEFYQWFIPGRYSSLSDILFNLIGVVLGCLLVIFLRRGLIKVPPHGCKCR